jgi:hypothetical protein
MGRRRAERTSEALSGQARGQRLAARLVVRGWRHDEVAGGCKTRGQPTNGVGGAEIGAGRERAGGFGDILRRWTSQKTALEQKREAEVLGRLWSREADLQGAAMVLLACG